MALWSLKKVAEELGCSVQTVRNYDARGELKIVHLPLAGGRGGIDDTEARRLALRRLEQFRDDERQRDRSKWLALFADPEALERELAARARALMKRSRLGPPRVDSDQVLRLQARIRSGRAEPSRSNTAAAEEEDSVRAPASGLTPRTGAGAVKTPKAPSAVRRSRRERPSVPHFE